MQYRNQEKIVIHNAADFEGMRKAGYIAASVLDYVNDFVKVGVTTDELDVICHEQILKHGATSASLNYKGFPKSVCTSVNHVVCHGIPSDKKLNNGDIINIDVTVIYNGWHGDTSRTFFVGVPSIKARRLVEATYESMMLGIDLVKPNISLNDVGSAIQRYAEKNGFSVVRDYSGHGIGKIFHAAPNVLHYSDPCQKNIILQEGMFFTIEPMLNAGTYKTLLLKDQWTVITRDRSLSAQFEHTIGVTKDGYEIFTLSPKGMHNPFSR